MRRSSAYWRPYWRVASPNGLLVHMHKLATVGHAIAQLSQCIHEAHVVLAFTAVAWPVAPHGTQAEQSLDTPGPVWFSSHGPTYAGVRKHSVRACFPRVQCERENLDD